MVAVRRHVLQIFCIFRAGPAVVPTREQNRPSPFRSGTRQPSARVSLLSIRVWDGGGSLPPA